MMCWTDKPRRYDRGWKPSRKYSSGGGAPGLATLTTTLQPRRLAKPMAQTPGPPGARTQRPAIQGESVDGAHEEGNQ